ncbi:MAG: transposase family protein, partial [Ottowia sp.]|nr:transposase family protein [Ottowia sp.]
MTLPALTPAVDARALLAAHVLKEAATCGIRPACAQLAAALADGSASAELLDAARAAMQRKRGGVAAPSAHTLRRWAQTYQAGGTLALAAPTKPPAPAPAARGDAPLRRALALYATKDAQWRNLAAAVRQAAKEAGIPSSALYSRARRALQKLGYDWRAHMQLIRSRHSGSEAKAMLPFRRREWGEAAGIKPLDIWVMDGHSFKAKVRHPIHGAPFVPELTLVLDGATRKIMGWSVSLSENAIAVGDALRHAISQHGVPAVLYTDNGAGETAKALDCPIDGFLARLGIEHRTGIPGNPQGRGIIERSWRTHAIACARQFASYLGSDVDE